MQKNESVENNVDNVNDELTLREDSNKQRLEEILDDLINESKRDLPSFYILFKNLPLNIYLKIDTLAHTYTDKKSESTKNIIKKAKYVNKKFHDKFK